MIYRSFEFDKTCFCCFLKTSFEVQGLVFCPARHSSTVSPLAHGIHGEPANMQHRLNHRSRPSLAVKKDASRLILPIARMRLLLRLPCELRVKIRHPITISYFVAQLHDTSNVFCAEPPNPPSIEHPHLPMLLTEPFSNGTFIVPTPCAMQINLLRRRRITGRPEKHSWNG